MLNRPLVSIIMPVLNGNAYLEQTILSVLGQTYDNIESIIIDGGSTDGSLETIKKYEDKINFGNESTDSIKLWNDNTRKLYQKYLKDIGDLLMKPDGNFQKFIWDIRSENDKLIQERQARGRKSSPYNY